MYFESHGHILVKLVTTASVAPLSNPDLRYYALLAYFFGLPATDSWNKNFVVPHSVLACKDPNPFQGYRRIPRRNLHFGINFETKYTINSNR
jgi:hypothetical protein